MFDELHLSPQSANYQALTPLSFFQRSLEVHAARPAIAWRESIWNYTEFGELVSRMITWLKSEGVGHGDVVSCILTNRPELLAVHFAVPAIGAVLNTINTRLNDDEVAYIIDHAGTRLVLCESATHLEFPRSSIPFHRLCSGPDLGDGLNFFEGPVESFNLLDGVEDESQPIALNYTSGTTGQPKGVVYTHRGAYLNANGNVVGMGFNLQTRYLWTLPMFHCNGWTHTWAVTAAGGMHVCLDKVDPALVVETISKRQVTHMCCAPVVLYMLLDHMNEPTQIRVKVGTGGAAPTPALLSGLEKLGFDLMHLYGLTESYGPVTINDPSLDDSSNDQSDISERAVLLARQGSRHSMTGSVRVIDEAGDDVAADGETIGEIVLRGNTMMAGYYSDPEATEKAFKGGYFHTGDLAVMHADGQIEIRDRAKDIIISGGENFSSLEVEAVLHEFPDVLLTAVVAAPHPKWGETAWAFIETREKTQIDEAALSAFCNEHLAGFKRPRKFILGTLPKTATGKIQKFLLREKAKEMAAHEYA